MQVFFSLEFEFYSNVITNKSRKLVCFTQDNEPNFKWSYVVGFSELNQNCSGRPVVFKAYHFILCWFTWNIPHFVLVWEEKKQIIWKPIEIDIGFKSHRFQCTNESFEFKLNKYLVGIYICKRWWLFLFSFCFCFDKQQYTMVLIIRIAFAFNELTKLPHQPHISNTDDECVINEFHCLGSFIVCTKPKLCMHMSERESLCVSFTMQSN